MENLVSNVSIDWFNLTLNLVAGLALFLYGIHLMVKSLVKVSGKQMRYFLAKMTTNRFSGAFSGAFFTAIIQSSSITTVLTVSFVAAGLMTLQQSAAIIMGANLGSTITAQLVAFEIGSLALLLIVSGISLQFISKIKRYKDFGVLLLGLGLLFYGMTMMKEAMIPLRNYEPFLLFMKEFDNLLYGLLAGMIFTAVIQSSSATLGIAIVLASNGFLTLPAGIALLLGANIGTTITALLASIGSSRNALRASLIHFKFNFLGALIWLPFIPQLAYFSQSMTIDNATNQQLADYVPRALANAHLIFNLINLLIFLPLIGVIVWMVFKLVPLKESEKNNKEIKPIYLDKNLLETPVLAFNAVRLEVMQVKEHFSVFFKKLTPLIKEKNSDKLSKQDLQIKLISNYQIDILHYLGEISRADLNEVEQKHFLQLMSVLSLINRMLETTETEFLSALHKMAEENIIPSDEMTIWITKLANEVEKSLDKAFMAVSEQDEYKATEVIAKTHNIDNLIQNVLQHQTRQLKPSNERIKIFRLEMKIIYSLSSLYTSSKRLARLALPQNKK
ncbi:MAG TPA: Na+/Pi-cotransporter [Thiomicrospira sp.]|jgi:phosphate:Na+ symporter|nr:Na+/Pi-cotransporter [Thiomicrospira sp.]